MSQVYVPQDATLNSSPAFPHLHACIETVVREAVQSGKDEESVRSFPRLHTNHFESVLGALNSAYNLPSVEETTNAPRTKPQQPSLLPADEMVERQPSEFKDGFKSDKVEDDPDELAVDEDAKKAGSPVEKRVLVRRPRAPLSYEEKKNVSAASENLQDVLRDGYQPPGTPTSNAGFAAGATVDPGFGSDDGSDTPRQRTFIGSSPPPAQPPVLGASASGTGVGVAEDEDAQTPVQAPAVHHFSPLLHATPDFPGRQAITDATESLRQAEERGFQPLESPAVGVGSGDGLDTPR
jgi:hypothetical protein